jgi:hypothetical protein
MLAASKPVAIWQLRCAQEADGADQQIRAQRFGPVPALDRDMPPCSRFVVARASHRGVEADVRPDAEVVGHPLEVRLNLLLQREVHAPVVFGERVRIDVTGRVHAASGIVVFVPRPAEGPVPRSTRSKPVCRCDARARPTRRPAECGCSASRSRTTFPARSSRSMGALQSDRLRADPVWEYARDGRASAQLSMPGRLGPHGVGQPRARAAAPRTAHDRTIRFGTCGTPPDVSPRRRPLLRDAPAPRRRSRLTTC